MKALIIFASCMALVTGSCSQSVPTEELVKTEKTTAMGDKIEKSEREWKEALTEEEFRVLRKQGTETAFTGEYWNAKDTGTYKCAGCGTPLFTSNTKFKSGTGWPSFYDCVEGSIATDMDRSHGMVRAEIKCAKCEGHLGHVFDDGPQPTGLRYCVNSISLDLEKEGE